MRARRPAAVAALAKSSVRILNSVIYLSIASLLRAGVRAEALSVEHSPSSALFVRNRWTQADFAVRIRLTSSSNQKAKAVANRGKSPEPKLALMRTGPDAAKFELLL